MQNSWRSFTDPNIGLYSHRHYYCHSHMKIPFEFHSRKFINNNNNNNSNCRHLITISTPIWIRKSRHNKLENHFAIKFSAREGPMMNSNMVDLYNVQMSMYQSLCINDPCFQYITQVFQHSKFMFLLIPSICHILGVCLSRDNFKRYKLHENWKMSANGIAHVTGILLVSIHIISWILDALSLPFRIFILFAYVGRSIAHISFIQSNSR